MAPGVVDLGGDAVKAGGAQGDDGGVIVAVAHGLVSADVNVARELAQDKGVGYQTYIRMLLHEALRRESARLSRSKV
jgi:hypothetical protein